MTGSLDVETPPCLPPPPAMAGSLDVETPPKKFRMVPVKNDYIYTLVSTENTWRNDWMWECGIPADGEGANPGEVLYIIHVTDNDTGRKSFMAMQAPAGIKTVDEILRFNDKVWTSSEDVFAPGAHSWEYWDCGVLTTMKFTTTIIEDSAH